jgi:hypothetical protein
MFGTAVILFGTLAPNYGYGSSIQVDRKPHENLIKTSGFQSCKTVICRFHWGSRAPHGSVFRSPGKNPNDFMKFQSQKLNIAQCLQGVHGSDIKNPQLFSSSSRVHGLQTQSHPPSQKEAERASR